jgi:hypothetical protein
MKPYFSKRSLIASLAVAAALGAPFAPAGAQTTDISQVPLGTASTTAVLPNLMFILDDSGSMGRHWMPDNVDASNTCKSYRDESGGSSSTNCILDNNTDLVSPSSDNVRHIPTQDWPAGPPAYAAQFNTMYYNPQITYSPGKDSGGADLPSFGSPWTAIPVNPYVSTNTVNLTTEWPEPVFCTDDNSTPTSTTECRRNGYDNAGTTLLTSFRYSNASTPGNGTFGWPESTGSGEFRYIRMRFGAPHYFMPSEDRRIPSERAIRHLRAHGYRSFGHDLRRPAQPQRLLGEAGLQLRRGNDQFRELGRLLPHPHADDENLRGSRVFHDGRSLSHRLRHHQRLRCHALRQSRQVRRHAQGQLVHNVLRDDAEREHAVAARALPRRAPLRRPNRRHQRLHAG